VDPGRLKPRTASQQTSGMAAGRRLRSCAWLLATTSWPVRVAALGQRGRGHGRDDPDALAFAVRAGRAKIEAA